MSGMLYSAATGGFYLSGLHGEGIPADAVGISDERYRELFEGQSRGARIVAGMDGKPVLEERAVPTQADLVALALATIDRDTDRIYTETIGARGEEYRLAEAAALQFQAAGFQGEVPAFVADSQAARPGSTAQQSAEEILQQAEVWRTAQAAIRGARLQRKAQARGAADQPALQLVLDQWADFVAAIRAQLGLPAA